MNQGKKVATVDVLEFSYSELIPRLEIKNMSDANIHIYSPREGQADLLIPTLSRGFKNIPGGNRRKLGGTKTSSQKYARFDHGSKRRKSKTPFTYSQVVHGTCGCISCVVCFL